MKSDSIKELATALAKAQGELHNPKFDATNPHYKSRFASLGAVREAVIPVFAKHGLSLSQWPLAEGNHAGCRSVLSHSSGEWMEEAFLIPVDKGNAHGYASAVTYAKRLSMQAIAAVVGDEDDDGNAAVGDAKKPSNNTATATMADEYDGLTTDEKTWIDDLAAGVKSWVEKGDVQGALDEMDAAIPYTPRAGSKDTEYKLALQSRLDSKTLTALKKARAEQLKKAA
jgi:hypothetical protein